MALLVGGTVQGQFFGSCPNGQASPVPGSIPPPDGSVPVDELRVISPILLRGKEVVFDFEGFETTAIEKRQGVVFYTPREGRYVLSLLPFEAAVQGQIRRSRVSFEMNGQSYAFLMGAPIARAEQMWILHEPTYKPSLEEPGRRDDQAFAGTSDLTHLLAKPPAKN